MDHQSSFDSAGCSSTSDTPSSAAYASLTFENLALSSYATGYHPNTMLALSEVYFACFQRSV